MATNNDYAKQLESTFAQGPAGDAGRNAFRAAYERLKGEAAQQRQKIIQDYSTQYQQAKQGAYLKGLGAAQASAGLSGGQSAVAQNKMNAQMAGTLADIQQKQSAALGAADTLANAAYSNALLEGQQVQDYATRQQDTALAREQKIQEIRSNNKLTDAEKEAQLKTIGATLYQSTATSPTDLNNFYTGTIDIGDGTLIPQQALSGDFLSLADYARMRGVKVVPKTEYNNYIAKYNQLNGSNIPVVQ